MTQIYFFGGFLLLALVGLVLFFLYRKSSLSKKQIERSLKMVLLQIRVPRDMGSKNNQGQGRDDREAAKEVISFMETFYSNLSVIYKKGIKNNLFHGQRHIALEIVARDKEIFFYIAAPVVLLDVVEKSLSSQYPEVVIEEVEEYNIFNPEWKNQGIFGGEFFLAKPYHFPLKTYKKMDAEPLESVLNTLSKLGEKEGAAIQILLRPIDPSVMKKSKQHVKSQIQGKKKNNWGLAGEFFDAAMVKEASKEASSEPVRLTAMEEEVNKAIEEKAGKAVFETKIRVIVSASDRHRSEMIVSEIEGSFTQFSDQNLNRFKFRKAKKPDKLTTDFIFRFFDTNFFRSSVNNILNTEELASIFHLPNYLVSSPGIVWLSSKRAEAPVRLSDEGTVLGKSHFRGTEQVVRISQNDKRRHVYILGQTGTGKSTVMKNMILSDIYEGAGVAYIDPHGQDVEDILARIPKERAEDVIYFDAGDVERPMGLNLFEAKTTEQKDFVIQEAIQMLYRLYDPGHTGIMGPRFEHWFRNAALALMADPAGATFIEVPRIFTDEKFLAEKLKHCEDPIVRNFWINEMGQTNDFHKSEVLGWFVGKFGAFMTNSIMRNILGQTVTSLNFRDIMDDGKILLVNLSKGKIGEINMMLLGMIFVSKIQMAAMSRADTPEDGRRDFYFYVDEFQNFATDSFAQILSESRKYRLSLIVANQFISQLKEEVRAAVFGNAGTVISFRVGPEDAEFMAKQFEPVFNTRDLSNLENYNAILKLLVNGVPSRPFNIVGNPPMGIDNPKIGQAIKELARLKHARTRKVVEKEVLERMQIGNSQNNASDLTRETRGF